MFGRVVRRVLRLLVAGVAGALVIGVMVAWRDLGRAPAGARLARMERSPEHRDGKFVNALPMWNNWRTALSAAFHASPYAAPNAPVPVVKPIPESLATAPVSGLRVTWFGHSSTLVEIDGVRILTDPLWGERPSPLGIVGPKRWFPPLIALDRLPHIDAVVISHDHYDHLDLAAVDALNALGATFIVPLGIGADLEYWGVPPNHIVELDWWGRHRVGNVEVVSTPSRHASGRQLFDRDRTLWTSYALIGTQHRVWYSGDTGFFPQLADIGSRLGPFDLTMIESGQYNRAWPDWHLGPEQAVAAHEMVRGKVMLPVHWGLVQLAPHGWTEPVERVLVEGRRRGVRVITPAPGVSVEPSRDTSSGRWWPTLPFETAEQSPVRATWVVPPAPVH